MNAFRIHSSRPDGTRIAYLSLEAAGIDAVRLDFTPMDPAKDHPLELYLSHAAIYELLEGKEAKLELPDQEVVLHPRQSEIVIDCRMKGRRQTRQYRVWTSELALAWNMLRDRPSDGKS